MGTSNKQKRLIEFVLRGLFVLAALPGTIATLFILPTLFFNTSGEQNYFSLEFLLYWLVPIVLTVVLVSTKKPRPWLIFVCYLILEMIFTLYMAAFEFPLLVLIAIVVACLVSYAYYSFVRYYSLKSKLYVLILIAILYGLFILPGNVSLNLYILVGEWLRDITNWKLNIFYFDYEGFAVLFASILSSLSVFFIWIFRSIGQEM